MRPPLAVPHALAALLLLPAAAGAQARLTGVVRDSLERAPLGGAVVQVVPADAPATTPQTAAADSAGGYAVPGLAPGRYLVAFTHPRLDSLGIAAPARAVDVPAGAPAVRLDLASPGAGAVASALCGARPPGDSTGVLFGRVLDAERGEGVGAGAAAVTVRWGEIVADGAGVRRVVRELRATAAPDGGYAVCGVPLGVPVGVSAAAAPAGGAGGRAAASGTVDAMLPADRPAAYRAVLVGAASPRGEVRRGTAGLAGRVVRADGRPAGGARVVVRGAGAADSVARADADGRYSFEALPAGTYRVDASAIGFAPVAGAADLRPGRTAALDFALGAGVATLDPVAVYGRRRVTQFERNMRRGLGRFVTEEQLRRGGEQGLVNALVASPGLRLDRVEPNGAPQIRATASYNAGPAASCTPEVYFDGALVADGFVGLYQLVSPPRMGAVEIYRPFEAPPQFRQAGSLCAAVVVWSKAALRRGG